MKRACAAAIALLCAACGGSPDTAAPRGAKPVAGSASAGAENAPPEIESVSIDPDPAGAADPLSLQVHARDPDQDRLSTRIEWYRNGELVDDLRDPIVDAGTFVRGDRVYAIAYVSDGTHEVSAQTPAIAIGNSAPRVRSVAVSPSRATSADLLEASPNVEDADGDSVQLEYRWYKNGALIPAATSSRLAPGAGRRGDKVSVEVEASDGSDSSGWVASPAVEIANAPPTITSQPGYEMAPNGVYSYEIAAKDPDGDQPLRFELVQGPKGMAVDDASGVVSWTVPQDARGNSPIEVAVSDGYGGRTSQRWVLSVDWSQPPASAATENASAPNQAAKRKPEARGESDEKTGAAKPKAKSAKATPKKSKASSGDDTETDQDQDQGEGQEEEEF